MNESRVSIERLRERTDELELLISGLTLLGLLGVPSMALEAYQQFYGRMPVFVVVVSAVAMPMVTTMCYSLAAFLVAHLTVRAYWVGLVGLRVVYPQGVDWSSPSLGPIQRERLMSRTESLDDAVERGDRLASTIFAMFVFSALVLAVLAVWLMVVFAALAIAGAYFGASDAFLSQGVDIFLVLLIGAVLSLWMLDGVLVRRFPSVLKVPGLRRLILTLAAIVGTLFPERLLNPIRLPLQTNLRRTVFVTLLGVVFFLQPVMGSVLFEGSRKFDPLQTQTFAKGAALMEGELSFYYESQRVPSDRLQGNPVIPDPTVTGRWLRLFLPYHAIRDNAILEHRCDDLRAADAEAQVSEDVGPSDAATVSADRAAFVASARAAECLARLWDVRLNGKPVPLQGFRVAQRHDLGFRGLAGSVSLQGEQPGPQVLEVIWRPNPETDPPMDDFIPTRYRFVIPFLWDEDASLERESIH